MIEQKAEVEICGPSLFMIFRKAGEQQMRYIYTRVQN